MPYWQNRPMFKKTIALVWLEEKQAESEKEIGLEVGGDERQWEWRKDRKMKRFSQSKHCLVYTSLSAHLILSEVKIYIVNASSGQRIASVQQSSVRLNVKD